MIKLNKVCKKCNELKLINEFGKRRDSVDGYRHDCKKCVSERVKNWGIKNFWRNRAKSFNNPTGRRKGIAGKVIKLSTPINEMELKDLFEKSPFCNYCKVPLDRESMVLEHKTPLSKNGKHEIENICISCHDCNQLKGTRTEEEFMEFISIYIKRFC